jgi:sugar phosphate isomerase/epimerase
MPLVPARVVMLRPPGTPAAAPRGRTTTVGDVQPHQPLTLHPRARRASPPPAGPSLALSTMWGIGRLDDLGALVDEARRLGVRQLELNDQCTPRLVEQVIARLGDEVRLCSLHNVCPWPVDDDGRRLSLPSLAEPDPIAREVIVRWTEETIRLAAYWGIPAVVIHLGELPDGRDQEAALQALVLAGQGETAGAGAARQRLIEHRRAAVGPYLAAAARSLEELLPLCEEAGVRLGLETRADYLDLPTFEELGELLARFDSEYLGYWHDTGHAQRQQALGLRAARDWLAAYGRRLVGLHLHDCVGLADHHRPGTGAVDFAAALAAAGAATPCVCEFSPRLSEAEVASGLDYLRSVMRDG